MLKRKKTSGRSKISEPKAKKAKRAVEITRTELEACDDSLSVTTTTQMEEDFPRGGQDILTPLERRGSQYQAQQDVLFGKNSLSNEDHKLLKQKKSKKGTEIEEVQDGKKRAHKISRLSPKNLSEGAALLGAVREIHQFNLIVSLPYNMTGVVSIGNISDPITELVTSTLSKTTEEYHHHDDDTLVDSSLPSLSSMFQIGQLVICCVRDIQKEQIELSLNPKLVNTNVTGKSLLPNMVLCGWVSSVEDHGYIVDFGITGKTGFILKKNANEKKGGNSSLLVGQVVNCVVLSGPSARAVPVSITSQAMRTSTLPADSFLPLSSLLPGLLVNATVKDSTKTGLLLKFLGDFEGSVSLAHFPAGKFDSSQFPIGKKVKVRLLWVDVLNKKIGLSLQSHIVSGLGYQFNDIEIGDTFHTSKVVSVDPHLGVVLELGNETYGFSPLRFLYNEKEGRVQKVHSIGSVHSCRAVQFNLIDGYVIVALKQSILNKKFMKFSDVKPGSILEGVVKTLTERGAYITLDDSFDGFCPNSELSDSGGNKIRKKFTPNSKVKCRILLTDHERRFILLTCRKSLIRTDLPPLTSYDDTQQGYVHDGVIVAVLASGLVVKFYNGVKGFVPKSEVMISSSLALEDLSVVYRKGQVVKCRVLTCIPESEKLILSLKMEEHAKDTCTFKDVEKVEKENVKKEKVDNDGMKNIGKKANNEGVKKNQSSNCQSVKKLSVVNPEKPERSLSVTKNKNDSPDSPVIAKLTKDIEGSSLPTEEVIPPLPIKGGFVWEETEDIDHTHHEPEEQQTQEPELTRKKSRRQKKAAKVAEESYLYEKEFELMKSSKPLETADDFERQLAVHPNSSALWLQYMAYYLHLADIEKARTIARKALSTISFREEQEKLNVWYGLLNLENLYGSQESLMAMFREALQGNEPLPLYNKLVEMYQFTDKIELAEQVFQTMTKKFSSHSDVWINYGLFLMKIGRTQAARNLMQRSLKSLSKQSQVMVISKFAQYEVKYSDLERGRTMFESLISSYPKRIDLWSVYIDMMTTSGQLDLVRNIFERAVNLNVSIQKTKAMFKKYLSFEENHGTSTTVNAVKKKAQEFVMQKRIRVDDPQQADTD